MINKLIKSFLENKMITFFVFATLVLWWIYVIAYETPVDALPDLSENQVVVMTRRPWQSPINVQDQITYPITVNMQWLAGVSDIRAMSQLGISMVTVIFDDDVDIYFARDRVSERLSVIADQLPNMVMPMLWPDATWLGQVMMYTLESEELDLTELRSVQDFYVKYDLQSIAWVAEVASIGGYERRYQVVVDPQKLHQYGTTLSMVMMALRGSSDNISANTINSDGSEVVIQWLGNIDSLDELEHGVIGMKKDGTPLLVRDVAMVREWGGFRRGILADEMGEKVGGIVVIRYGENPLEIIDAVKAKMMEMESSLPADVSIDIFYDRTDLINWAINTLSSVLIQMIIITTIILGIFLRHRWATLATVISLVVGMILTFIFMRLFNIPSNIMSLWWIAIAIGTMVDAAIVVTENAYQAMVGKEKVSLMERVRIIKKSTLEVGKPIAFAVFIIMLSFIPIFSLQGMEGKLFSPLAWTNIFAMLGALLAALFLVPSVMVFVMKGKMREDRDLFVVRFFQKRYGKLLTLALKWRKATLALVVWLLVGGFALASTIWTEFMPPLDEWSIMYMPMTVPDVSEEKALELLLETNDILADIPEVEEVVGKAWRADTATDPAPLAMLETFITLKPKSERRSGMTKEKLIAEMNRKIRIDNLWNGFTQPIIGRIEMLSTGLKGDVGIKIFGDDPAILEEYAVKVEKAMAYVPWANGVVAIRTAWLRYLNIDIQDHKLALYGVKKSDVLSSIAAWVGGMPMATTIEWRERYTIEVKLNQEYRNNIDAIRSLMVMGVNGSQVTLDAIADIRVEEWPATIASENGIMRSAVQMNVVWVDLVSFVEDAQQHIAETIELPAGYALEFAGSYNNQLRAKKTLSVVVPVVILLILFILYLTYKDWWLVSIVWLSIPFSIVGGIFGLYFRWFNFSVAVWIGLIVLFGNAVETWVVIMVYLENAFRERFGLPLLEEEDESERQALAITHEGIYEAIKTGAMRRLRPILMTAFTSIIGLLPMLISAGIGSELQKPLAVVVVTGLITSVFLTLIVLPILFAYLRERRVTL